MKYKHNLYTLLILFCATFLAQNAVAQVSENKYSTSSEIVLNFHVTVENDNNKELQKAFDGDKENTWWNASSAGPKTITISLDNATKLSKINYYGGGNKTNTALRPAEIKFYSSSDGSNWEPFYTVSNIDRTVRDQTIEIPSTSRVTSKYYQIVFVPGTKVEDGQTVYETLAFNEITLYDNESKVISVRDVLNINNLENASIQHKSAKWFDLKAQFNLSPSVLGSFSYDEPRFDAIMSNGQKIQATHTYIDTIYMHKGEKITLALPTKSTTGYASSSSAQTYQRWYSYRTGGTFETNHKTSTESEKTVYDLLTPNTGNPSGGVPAYRFKNGYVGRPMGAILQAMDFYYPTDEEFDDWFPNTNVDNNWFVVACDVSGYTDFSEHFTSKESAGQSLTSLTEEFKDNNWYEPTLSVRVIFYIVGVDDRPENDSESWKNGHGRLEQTEFQTSGDNAKYLEEYDITFPNKHLSNHTNELVAISKDARSYAIPDANNDRDTLDLKIESKAPDGATNLLSLSKGKLTGTDRVIQFYRDGYSGKPWEVPDGTTATITVRKTVGGTTYNIARFNLTFSAASVPLTQVEVANIKDGSNLEFRSPTWMNNNLQKLTELTFDYPAGVTWEYGQKEYFTFPLAWDYSSYAFFDGSPWGDFIGSASYSGPRRYAEFDYYSLVSDYMGYADQKTVTARPQPGVGKVDGTGNHFLYVDASDRPGILARLPFKEKLCTGSELFVTAWMKSSGQSGSDDAAVLFTIMGVDSLENGTVTYTPLYRHSSSQIRTTCWLSGDTPGTGVGTNNWYQIYFSFLNDSENAQNFDSYILQVENNCASTEGGDYYIDDIKVYLAQPNATITQKEYTCTDTRTRMNMEIDWERLKARLGNAETGEDGISFCFMDETKYNNYLKAHPNATKAAALKESIVEIGDGKVIDTRVMTMKFFNDFDENDKFGYSTLDKDGSVADGNFFFAYQHMKDNKPYFYRVGSETDAAGRRLTVDFYSVLSPNRPYIMLIMPDNPNSAEDEDALISDLADQIGDPCSIYTRFYVTSETLIKVNGEVVDPSVDFCAGQVFNFTVQVRVPKADGENEDYIVLDNGVYFDWFFGTEEEFRTEDPDLKINLDVALTNFRAVYPNATELSEQTPPKTITDDGSEITFSQADYDLIEKYIKDTGAAAGVNNRLVLHREDLDIALLHDGLNLVVKPIQTLMPPSGSGISDKQWAQVCWEYIPLILNANGSAPNMHAGFEEVKYPTDDYNPGLRIGLQQIEEATDDENKSLRINLREAKVVTAGASLGKINRDGLDQIFLINSDDPQYKDLFTSTDLEATSLPIGTVEDMYVKTEDMSMSYMDVRFNLKEQKISGDRSFTFNPREGYTYTFSTYFEEKNSDSNSEDIYNTCYGSFPIDMKVVPEYLVWQGGATSNWNNDANWKRADKSALKKADSDSYPTNEANTTENGFVPMLFSNVVMPRDSKAELYMAGYAEGGAAWSGSDNRPDGMESPTENIQYDLMAYEKDGAFTTQRYRVNICRDIHFEPDAQMLHAEQLLYDKAWTDVEITPGQWTAVSTPLQDVVAGDWYAPTATGRQETEYFKDIKFTDGGYDRLNPAVYQRSWSTGATIVEKQAPNTSVSFATEWSSAYNDASVPYVAGGGFSIKGVTSNSSLLFRFPKADTEYTVSTAENKTVDRTTAGRLLVSQMVDRSNPLQYVHSDVVTATLTPSIDGKYLMVGNPFMAPLDVQAFVAANSDVLAQKYWIGDMSEANAVAYDSETGWSAKTSIAPYSVFYVQVAETATPDEKGNFKVKFTADMQKFATSSTDAGSQAASLKITAEDAEGSSSAAVRYAASASNGFGMEDAQMISGLTGNADNAPQVYTVAGNTAVSVNQLKDAQRIPLGVTAADGSVVTLTFSGVAAVKDAALYDAELQSETPLHEGYQLTVNGSSYGRYFLIGKGPGTTTGISDVETDGNVSVSSILPRQIVVTSDVELRSVSVWSVSGALLKKVTLNGDYTCTLNNVDSDVVVVRTETANGTQMTKLRVR